MDTTKTPEASTKAEITPAIIEAALHDYCSARTSEAEAIGGNFKQLWQEIDHYVSGGGKRIRPRIFVMMHDFYGGNASYNGVLSVACAWEMLHASVLIHDDIIDRDSIRHGKLNIAGRYEETYSKLTKKDARHYALSAALMAGDLLISSAYDIVSKADLTDSQKILMQHYISRAVFSVVGGELLDTESALYPISSVDTYAIANHKTASYSFQVPLESGAMLAGAPEEDLQKLNAIGLHAGIAFQLKDDLLGVFGDSAVTGKSNRSDLLEKKRTLLIQKVLESASSEDKTRLLELYAHEEPLTANEAEEVYECIIRSGVKEEIERHVQENTDSALRIANTLSVSEQNRQTLITLISGLVGRQS